ncbi:tandem-95 repeat protein, partial [Sulfuricurvum sp.]|uniref:tandem-95 repeat protein n=1 Tax=Sulfuricurvum sp. TaxID=2025608 RepID=UPI003C6157AB
TGAVTLTADPNFETKSSYSFNVIATDNGTGALSDTQAVTLAINDVNEAPVVNNPVPTIISESTDFAGDTTTTASLGYGGAATGTITPATDTDWYAVNLVAGITYEISLRGADSAGGTLYDTYVELRDNTGTYITGDDDGGIGLDSLLSYTPSITGTYYVNARSYNSNYEGTYTLTVTPSVVLSTPEDTVSYTITQAVLLANATDEDGDLLSVTALSAANGVIVDNHDGTWTYTPNSNYNGLETLSYTVSDGAISVPATMNMVVTPVDDAPVALDATGVVVENGSVDITLSASDIDSLNLLYGIDTVPANGSVSMINNIVTYTPNAGFFGTDTFTYYVSAADGMDTATVSVTVTPADYVAPYIVDAQFVKGTTTTLTMVFSEDIQVNQSLPATMYLNGSTLINQQQITNMSVVGNTLTLTIAVATTSSDVISLNAPFGAILDLAGNSSASGTIIAGSSDASTMDLNTLYFEGAYSDRIVFGGDGNDVITGTNYPDIIHGGEGADTIASHWGADYIHLDEATAVRDTVMVSKADSDEPNSSINSYPYNIDTVFNFDTTSTTAANHDVLGYATVQIKANMDITDGVDAGTIAKHSVTSGIVTFYTSANTPVVINSTNLSNAVGYLQTNLAINDTVGIKYDSDSSGSVDTLLVYQKSEGWNDSLIALANMANIGLVTLGTTAGANVVQIADKVGPQINNAAFVDNNTFTIGFNEAIASTTISDANTDLQIGNGATIGGIVAGTYTPSGNTITIDTGVNTWGTSSYVVMTTTATVTDAVGNSSTIFDAGEKGVALGNEATSLIDIRALIGDYSIINFLSAATTATLIGNSGNNYIEGGSGNDTITGGTGADEMRGVGMDGAGDDTFVFAQGDSTIATWHDNDSSTTLSNNDVFTFVAGADMVETGDFVVGDSAAIQLVAGMTQTTDTTGTVGENQFKLVEGWYDWDSSVFTVQSGGNSSLVLYDGTAGAGVSLTGIVLPEVSAGILSVSGNVINYVL